MDLTIRQLVNNIKNDLTGFSEDLEAAGFVRILLEEYAGISNVMLALEPDKVVSQQIFDQIEKAVIRLKNFEPIQYILGKTEFYGLIFQVNNNVLIPRPETEELVEWIIRDINKTENLKSTLSILDIGTGSGCIAITLKKLIQNAYITAIDISKEALQLAAKNAELNDVEIEFREVDIFDQANINKLGEFDLIVSNPPYVLESQKPGMQPNVLNYEPAGALYVGNENPLVYYKAILVSAETMLKSGGHLYVEINEILGNDMISLLENFGYFDIELRKDLKGKDRMVRATKHPETIL